MLNPKASRAMCVRILRLLQEERERRGISKYALAIRSGLSPQMIGYVERQMRNPTLETVLLMANAMEADLEKMISQAREEAETASRK